MVPKRDEYLSFLKTAIEKLTVSRQYSTRYQIVTNPVDYISINEIRKRLAKIDFRQL
jgi:hypothetical protein